MIEFSKDAMTLLKTLEGLRLEVYKDAAGVPTIGYGHVLREGDKHKISKLEAALLLKADLERFTRHVWQCCDDGGRIPSQAQFDAMVCLAFNIGEKGFLKSSVLRRFVNHDDAGAASAFLLWNKIRKLDKATGRRVLRPSRTLEARRMAEARVFLHGYYDPTPYDPLDDKGRMAEMHLSRNHIRDENVGAGESEIRPDLKSSRTMKQATIGQVSTITTGIAGAAGAVKVVADQISVAAEAAKNAASTTGEAARVAGETASLFSNLPFLLYIIVGICAIISTISFVFVRRTRRDDWRRGRR